MFAIGLVFGLTTAYLEKEHVGAKGEAWDLSALERGLLAGRIAWFYLGKLLAPANLTFIYPRWDVSAASWWQYLFPVAAIAVVGLLWRFRRRLGRGPLVAVLIFGGTLTPALGFIDVYPMRFSYVADHFQYHASMAAITLFTAAIAVGATGRRRTAAETASRPATMRNRGLLLPIGGGVLLLTLSILTWRQGRIYEDRETLWRDTIAKNPSAWIAHNNLGDTLIVEGRLGEAEAPLVEALRLHPDYPEALANLCFVQGELGQTDEAERNCRKALRVRPDWPLALTNLCRVLAKQGRYDEAITACRHSIALKPDVAQAHTDMALVLAGLRQMEEARRHFAESVRLDPDSAEARHNLAIALFQTGRREEAIAQWDEALRLKPDFDEASRSRAQALAYMRGGAASQGATDGADE
jgi:tetratricopeptide (TPR) repeat protein